ncbi:MAG: zinc ribbon domain-containing protein [Candidatus Limnocylindria bacterium]
MADHFCPTCGTEVDEDARFCPSCGQTLDMPGGEDGEALDMPAAPTWPEPAAAEVPGGGAPAAAEAAAMQPAHEDATDEESADEEPADEDPTRLTHLTRSAEPGPPPGPAPEAPAAPPPVGERAGSAEAAPPGQPMELPFSWPATIAGWLIGGGSIVGAAALIPSLGDLVSVFLFLALLAVTATIFLPDRLPEVPRLRLLVLLVTMVGLGMSLDRAAFTVRGIETVLLIAMLAAAGGALLIELDRDRPVPPPGRGGG